MTSTTQQQQQVLTIPRSLTNRMFGFVPINEAHDLLARGRVYSLWLDRVDAEKAKTLIQPIACGILLNSQKQVCLFRQKDNDRPDLNGRLTFIVGGHVDLASAVHNTNGSIPMMLEDTLVRELMEEINLNPIVYNLIGLAVDRSSAIDSSRHIGFVYEVQIKDEQIHITDDSDLSHSSPCEFIDLRDERLVYTDDRLFFEQMEFDPWSSIVFPELLRRTSC